jgi:hypothetical protein
MAVGGWCPRAGEAPSLPLAPPGVRRGENHGGAKRKSGEPTAVLVATSPKDPQQRHDSPPASPPTQSGTTRFPPRRQPSKLTRTAERRPGSGRVRQRPTTGTSRARSVSQTALPRWRPARPHRLPPLAPHRSGGTVRPHEAISRARRPAIGPENPSCPAAHPACVRSRRRSSGENGNWAARRTERNSRL